MKQTTAPKSETPSPSPRETKPHAKVGKNDSPGSVFVAMAFDMSWRLAGVVLIPIIGGFELDQYLGTVPLLTILGFLLAMAGMALVLRQTMRTADNLAVPKKGRRS